jgi:hypothetical protein
MSEESPLKQFKDITAEDIKQECLLVEDLLKVSQRKPSLMIVAYLMASLILEKTLRHILYREYKTITKIKFSVLIDKVFQKNWIDVETAIQFRKLKSFRNASVHHGLINIMDKEMLMPIHDIVQQIHHLLDHHSPPKEY